MCDDDWEDDDAAPSGFTGQRASASSLPPPPKPQYGGGRRPPRPRNRDDVGLIFQIASSDTGKLIGRGGSRIKELRDTSGCQIDIGDESSQSGETDVHIYGLNQEKIEKAQSIIEEALGYNNAYFSQQTTENPEEQIIDWGNIKKEYEEAQKVKWAKCPTLIKNFYSEHPEVSALSGKQVSEFRISNNNIVVTNFHEDSETPLMNPVTTFEQAFHEFPEILDTINKQGFENPSPIQAQGWPYLLSGKDLIGIAQTGTGKTLAFLMPCFVHIDGQPKIDQSTQGPNVPSNNQGTRGPYNTGHTQRKKAAKGPNVLVLSPTRELALQIADEVKKYEYRGIKSVCIYGGGDRKKQMNVVTHGVEIIIATPGRLNDLVDAGVINVESITYLVLDEADRMLDMGFEPQIRKVLLDIRPDRQTVMTSATWPPGVRRLASSYMTDPVTVFIGTLDLAAVHSVTQKIILIQGLDGNGEEEKRDILMEFFDNMLPDDKVMVFIGKKSKVDDIASDLSLKGIVVQSIHGDRDQLDREQALEDLKDGTVKILLATDVASRGIDIQDITHVINFDFPRNIEEYVHRVGRTGRAGKTGTSITFMERRDRKNAQELIRIMQEAGQEVPEELAEMADKYERYKARMEENKAQFGAGAGDGCFKCGQQGHFSRECPNNGGGGGGNSRNGASGGGGGCFNCGQPGHFSRECPLKRR